MAKRSGWAGPPTTSSTSAERVRTASTSCRRTSGPFSSFSTNTARRPSGFRFQDEFFLAPPAEGLDGAFPRQGPGPAAALFSIDDNDRAMSPGVARGRALLVLPKSAVHVGGHSGIEGAVAAFQNVEGPNGPRGRVLRRLVRPGAHLPKHAAVGRFHLGTIAPAPRRCQSPSMPGHPFGFATVKYDSKGKQRGPTAIRKNMLDMHDIHGKIMS